MADVGCEVAQLVVQVEGDRDRSGSERNELGVPAPADDERSAGEELVAGAEVDVRPVQAVLHHLGNGLG